MFSINPLVAVATAISADQYQPTTPYRLVLVFTVRCQFIFGIYYSSLKMTNGVVQQVNLRYLV
jgi:hypothetical protein